MTFHPIPTPLLPYDTPVGAGMVRVHAPSPKEIYIEVGVPPVGQQVAGLIPVGLLFLLLSVAFGLLLFGALFRPGAIPYSGWLLVPTGIGMGFTGMELLAGFRGWSLPAKLVVVDGMFRFPYPTPRSPMEEIGVGRIDRLGVVRSRTRFLRRQVSALNIGLTQGPSFVLFRGYPMTTLDELTDALGPALGLTVKDGGL